MTLEKIEDEFITFISRKTNKPREKVLTDYIHTRKLFNFSTDTYKQTCNQAYELNKLIYGEDSDEELISAYKYHELMHTYRFLSYSFPAEDSKKSKLSLLANIVKKGDYNKIFNYAKRVIYKRTSNIQPEDTFEPEDFKLLATYLLNQYKNTPTSIVDYGCGPAYVSFEIAQQLQLQGKPVPMTYLVDIDCLINEFVFYRFNLYNFPVEKITICAENMYPILPKHDICIATEVMEHIKNPVLVFTHINDALQNGGVLHGNFSDHDKHMFHVSPDLQTLRQELVKNNYTRLGKLTYKKD